MNINVVIKDDFTKIKNNIIAPIRIHESEIRNTYNSIGSNNFNSPISATSPLNLTNSNKMKCKSPSQIIDRISTDISNAFNY
jgi:hypothetical protein